MKKAIFAAFAAITVFCTALPIFAASSSISIKNNDMSAEPVSYTYDAQSSGEIVKSVKSLMIKLDELKRQKSVVQTLTLTSINGGDLPVNFKLRLSIPDKNRSEELPEKYREPSDDEYASLDYYNIRITTAEGDVVYDSSQDTQENADKKTYKDIDLGRMNEKSNAENKIINVTLSVNKALNIPSVAETAEKLDWSIVSDTYEREAERAADITAESKYSLTAIVIITAAGVCALLGAAYKLSKKN